MPKRLIRFNIPLKQPKQDIFLKDPKADFIVILQKKIFPLHKQLLSPSIYFQELIQANNKSVAINSHFNVEVFQQILGCFYGIEASFQRHNLIDNVIGIISFLKVSVLENQLITDMNVNFEQYGLFNLFYLSNKFKLTDIQSRCIKQLIDQDFEQINYNKYDLFQLDVELFIFVLKEHERLKNKKQITGLDCKSIKAVCDEYCKTNSAKVDIQEIFKYGRTFAQESLSDCDSDQPRIRKRNATWNAKDENSKKSTQETHAFNLSSDKKIHSFEQKQNELIKIRLINSNMQQNNNKLAAEINSVRNQIDKSVSKDISYGVDQLEKKLKQFEQKSKNAQKKMQELKNKMINLNIEDQVSYNVPNEGKQRLLSIFKKTNQQQSSIVLSSMAVLQKSEQIDSDASDF